MIREKGFDPKGNYCTWSPDKLFGVVYKYACYLHDRQYRNEVKVRQTRLVADLMLWVNIVKEFWMVSKPKVILGFFIGMIYFLAVNSFGKRTWGKGGENGK